MSMERRMPVVGTLWVVLPRSAAVFACASSPAVPVGWSGWDMRAQKHPVISRMHPLSPGTQGSRGLPWCAPPGQPWCWLQAVTAVHRELVVAGTSVCRIWPPRHCILLVLLFRGSDALLSQTPLHGRC